MSLTVTTGRSGTRQQDTLGGVRLLTTHGVEVARRTLDLAVAGAGLVATAPIMLVIAAIIRIDSPGPILFRQTRVGRNRRLHRCPEAAEPNLRSADDIGGRPFVFYKFRTMYSDARTRFPELYTYSYTSADLQALPMKVLMGRKGDPERFAGGKPKDAYLEDPRVTPVGRWLRKSSLDELPNLFNVLRGDMHLVGPRPDIPENIRYYRSGNLRKLSVRPGVTGLAQIRGRGLLSFQDTNNYDIEYVDSRSLWLDLRILAGTFMALVKRDGAF